MHSVLLISHVGGNNLQAAAVSAGYTKEAEW
jgi:hypothetical protein